MNKKTKKPIQFHPWPKDNYDFLDCPFCGGTPSIMTVGTSSQYGGSFKDVFYTIRCSQCRMEIIGDKILENVITSWNTRYKH